MAIDDFSFRHSPRNAAKIVVVVIRASRPGQEVQLVEPIAVDSEGNIIENATTDRNNNVVFVDGEKVKDATIVTKQFVPMGPGASQIAIKQLGTNGGGFFGVILRIH